MENKEKDNVELLMEKGNDFLSAKIGLYKLKAIDKSSDVAAEAASKSIVSLIFLIAFLIANIGIAILLGEWLGKSYVGFFIVAGFYLIAGFIVMLMQKKWLRDPIADKLVEKMMQ